MEAFSKAIKINPNEPGAYYDRGQLKNVLGDHEGAIEDYTKAIEANPRDSRAYFKRGVTKIFLNREDGCSDFNKGKELTNDKLYAEIKKRCS